MIPERYSSQTFALMRIVFGFVFFSYGLQKLGLFGGQAVPLLTSRIGYAGLIEMTCGLLILVGLFTRIAAFLASGEMAFAYFSVHQPMGGLPVQNQGVPAVLFCFAWLYLASRGAGIWSVDGARRGAARTGTAG
jgi:putative oxidoreductase